jgi:sec-independent protein translocase protein TatA
MFPKLGMGELVVILIIVIVLFGANKLPQLGEGLGRGIRSFKRAFGSEDDEKPAPPPPPPTTTDSSKSA